MMVNLTYKRIEEHLSLDPLNLLKFLAQQMADTTI